MLDIHHDNMASLVLPCYESGCPIPPDFLWGLVGTDDLHAVFLKVVTGVADPQGMKRF
jgi:hypothetical protein